MNAYEIFYRNWKAMLLKNCHTQFSTYTKKMLKNYMLIEETDVKFVIDDMNMVGSSFISFSAVKDKNEFD